MLFKTLTLCLLCLAFFTQNAFAQQEEKPKKKIEIVTVTVDENGEEKVTKIVREGEDANEAEIEKLLKEHVGESKTIDVTVEVGDDGKENIFIHENGKDGKVSKHVIVKKGENVEAEGEGKGEMIFITEDGEVTKLNDQDVKVIKKKAGEGDEMEISIEKEMDGDQKMIWIEKDEAQKGDVIIIEEETTEEKGEDGKTIKKTVKKKKTIKKNGGQ